MSAINKASEIAPLPSGVVSIGDHFTDGNVHLISNYWGLNSFLEVPDLPAQLDVAFITTASRPYAEFNEPTRFLDAERSWLTERQAEERLRFFEYCVVGRDKDEIREDLDGINTVFMGGGNTQYLLEQLQLSGADQVIRDMVRDGTWWYLGKSAGAVVAGPDIEPRGFLLRSMASGPLENTTGMGLTSVYPLPHIDTPDIMNREYDGKTGWQHAIEMAQAHPTAYILDNAHKNKQ